MVEKTTVHVKKTAQFSATMVIKTIESTLKYICTFFHNLIVAFSYRGL